MLAADDALSAYQVSLKTVTLINLYNYKDITSVILYNYKNVTLN